jgi:hypothetical protein
MGNARKPTDQSCALPDQANSQAPSALAADFFDSIDPYSPFANH